MASIFYSKMKDELPVLFPTDAVAAAVFRYCRERSVPLPEHMLRHAELTEKITPMPEMMVSPLQAQYLLWMTKSLGAKKVLEIGCFTGFSALTFAEALKDVEGAKIVTTDIDPVTITVARKVFAETKTDNLITLIEGPAEESLKNLQSEGPFDLVFLDANKEGYPTYFNLLLDLGLIRSGGVLIADNILKAGLVVDDSLAEQNPGSKNALAMSRVPPLREFNDLAARDPRVETMLLPVFDGLALVRVK